MDERTFRVGISHGLRRADGIYDLKVRGLDGLAAEPGIELVYLDDHSDTMRPDQLANLDAVVLEKVALRAFEPGGRRAPRDRLPIRRGL